jgi:hypothetical protein
LQKLLSWRHGFCRGRNQIKKFSKWVFYSPTTICGSTWLKFKRNNRKAMNMFYWNTTKKKSNLSATRNTRNPLHCCYHVCCQKTMMKLGVSHGPHCVSCIIDMTHFKHIHDELSQLDKMITDVIHFPVFPTQHQWQRQLHW